MPPPFNINETAPAPSSLISSFPADEQANRAEIEEWLTFISDPATGLIRESVLPPASTSIPAGTKMLFQQTAAPTGWTKDVTHNNKALRIVNGTVTTGGTVAFSTAFASKSVEGTNSSTAAAGTNSSTTATGSNSSTTSSGTVGATALTEAQLPAHTHSFSATTSSDGAHTHSYTRDNGGSIDRADGPLNTAGSNASTTGSAGAHTHTVSGTTGSAGSGTTHTHGLTMNSHTHTFTGVGHTHTFTGTSHTHTFTGTAIDLAVQFVDFIIATKDA